MTTLEQWEQRYRQPGYWAGKEPSAFLVELLPLLPRGRALDLAAGEGRNAVFLASRGWRVVGMDRSPTALDKAEALARERGVAVERGALDAPAPRAPGLLLVAADLEGVRLPEAAFDVLLCFHYLQRSLFGAMARALRPAGVLVCQTYTLAQLEFSGGPRDPAFLLRPGELREAFPDLEVWFASESNAGKGIASLVARRPAPRRASRGADRRGVSRTGGLRR